MHTLRIPTLLTAALAAAQLSSCRAISLADQRLLSRPGMQLGERGALSADCGLTGQVERGRATASNAAGGGCSSCH